MTTSPTSPRPPHSRSLSHDSLSTPATTAAPPLPPQPGSASPTVTTTTSTAATTTSTPTATTASASQHTLPSLSSRLRLSFGSFPFMSGPSTTSAATSRHPHPPHEWPSSRAPIPVAHRAEAEDRLLALVPSTAAVTSRAHIAHALAMTRYSSLNNAAEYLEDWNAAFTGALAPVDRRRPLAGIENSGNTCYIDSLLFALFARLDAFDCWLTQNFDAPAPPPPPPPASSLGDHSPGPDQQQPLGSSTAAADAAKAEENARRLWLIRSAQTQLTLAATRLRAGHLVTRAEMRCVESAIKQLWAHEGSNAGLLGVQEDAAELFLMLASVLRAPSLPLWQVIHHGADRDDADDRRVCTERLLQLAIPDPKEKDPVSLEALLSAFFFDNKVTLVRKMSKTSALPPTGKNKHRRHHSLGDPRVSGSANLEDESEQELMARIAAKAAREAARDGGTAYGHAKKSSDSSSASRWWRSDKTQKSSRKDDAKKVAAANAAAAASGRQGLTRADSALETTVQAWSQYKLLPFLVGESESGEHSDILAAAGAPIIVPMMLKRYYRKESNNALRRTSRQVLIPIEIAFDQYTEKLSAEETADAVGRGKLASYSLVLQSVVCHLGDSPNTGHFVTFVNANGPRRAEQHAQVDIAPVVPLPPAIVLNSAAAATVTTDDGSTSSTTTTTTTQGQEEVEAGGDLPPAWTQPGSSATGASQSFMLDVKAPLLDDDDDAVLATAPIYLSSAAEKAALAEADAAAAAAAVAATTVASGSLDRASSPPPPYATRPIPASAPTSPSLKPVPPTGAEQLIPLARSVTMESAPQSSSVAATHSTLLPLAGALQPSLSPTTVPATPTTPTASARGAGVPVAGGSPRPSMTSAIEAEIYDENAPMWLRFDGMANRKVQMLQSTQAITRAFMDEVSRNAYLVFYELVRTEEPVSSPTSSPSGAGPMTMGTTTLSAAVAPMPTITSEDESGTSPGAAPGPAAVSADGKLAVPPPAGTTVPKAGAEAAPSHARRPSASAADLALALKMQAKEVKKASAPPKECVIM
ncbi:hypothetical protein BC828DRAFT_418883 [Blastocladiella britannica]|nr:hypothetical protein BC828DRAFT_418883 [Blastocladiella britannica]